MDFHKSRLKLMLLMIFYKNLLDIRAWFTPSLIKAPLAKKIYVIVRIPCISFLNRNLSSLVSVALAILTFVCHVLELKFRERPQSGFITHRNFHIVQNWSLIHFTILRTRNRHTIAALSFFLEKNHCNCVYT